MPRKNPTPTSSRPVIKHVDAAGKVRNGRGDERSYIEFVRLSADEANATLEEFHFIDLDDGDDEFFDDDILYINNIEIAADRRGLGLGKKLLEAATKGVTADVWLISSPTGTTDPEGFYKKLGFEAVDRNRYDQVLMMRRPVRKNPDEPAASAAPKLPSIPTETARALLREMPVDKNGKVKVDADGAKAWVEGVLRVMPGLQRDRYGNFLLASSKGGESTRYHFSPQRLQLQRKLAGGDWQNARSMTFKDAAQSFRITLARVAGEEATVEQARGAVKAIREKRAEAHLKAAKKRAELVQQGRLGVAIEVERPDVIQALVLDQHRMSELPELLRTATPAPAKLPDDPHRFFLAPFTLRWDQASPIGFDADTDMGPVTVAQVPVQPAGRETVHQCDLHIGNSGTFFRVSPRSGGVSFGMGEALKGVGPGYLAATFDLTRDADGETIVRSELFFLTATEKRKGVGRALVQLWLDLMLAAVGGRAERLRLRIKSIVDEAWPFWNKLGDEGVYVVVGGDGANMVVLHPAIEGRDL